MSSMLRSASKAFVNPPGRRTLALVVFLGAITAGWVTRSTWLPLLGVIPDIFSQVGQSGERSVAGYDQDDPHDQHDEHADRHEHYHPGHSEEAAVSLSDNALRNIGYQAVTVLRGSFERTITIPAMVVEQAGRTQIHITAPMTGVVTRIDIVKGEALEPGQSMFELRLTHEDLVRSQREYLQTAANLDVVKREIARLESLAEGVIAGKRILEQKYEQQKLEATLRAAEQALLLNGLSEQQVAEILKSRKLLRLLTIRAPQRCDGVNDCDREHLFHVQSLPVSLGERVQAGEELAVLADHCELFVEGLAFEEDTEKLRTAAREAWPVTAQVVGDSAKITGLKLQYLADQIDPNSRAFRAYLLLPNEVVLDRQTDQNHRFIEWRFKPGQRMELSVPVEQWTDRIVLPASAVVHDGAETFVYRRVGDHFDRVSVHVEYRDRNSAVIADHRDLAPGDLVAGEGAFQIHLAQKNKSTGGTDPHAGHDH